MEEFVNDDVILKRSILIYEVFCEAYDAAV
jgi:hypothetical protein